ncbi:hypothetical protein G6F63_011793 [Rhizopus arrhizus]|nr:hypothetical protein G6F30_012018 [Rhizopus arrhizus]KAG1328573.1 hypothetical protein G6F63_011793 [Rhizopus arrhizus]KAG1410851.1 hypothetical protein G6F59_011876 [Rhizopus arrhizus]
MPRALPQDTQDSIKSALMSNRRPKDIAGEFGIHPKTVRRYRNKLFAPMVPATRGRHILVSSATNEYIKALLIKGALKAAKDAHRMIMRLGYSMPYRSAINVLVVVFTLIISLMSCEITQKILKINNLTVYHI